MVTPVTYREAKLNKKLRACLVESIFLYSRVWLVKYFDIICLFLEKQASQNKKNDLSNKNKLHHLLPFQPPPLQLLLSPFPPQHQTNHPAPFHKCLWDRSNIIYLHIKH